MSFSDPNVGAVSLPGLCGCGHDEAYHYRPVFQRAEDNTMQMVDQTGCTSCRCPKYDPARSTRYRGLGELAGKEYPDGGKH